MEGWGKWLQGVVGGDVEEEREGFRGEGRNQREIQERWDVEKERDVEGRRGGLELHLGKGKGTRVREGMGEKEGTRGRRKKEGG